MTPDQLKDLQNRLTSAGFDVSLEADKDGNMVGSVKKTVPGTPTQIPNVLVDFIDGNSVWREWGTLEVTPKYFVLRNDKGTRIFPLRHRRAEVYFEDSEGVFIVDHGYDMSNAERDVHNQTNK